MTTHLLDANVLIALVLREHEFHDRAQRWLDSVERVAVCPIVEGALVRFLMRLGESAQTAATILAAVHERDRCEFWPDSLSYQDLDLAGLQGHRQVTDTYLAALAASRGARLATFDAPLARRLAPQCMLIR